MATVSDLTTTPLSGLNHIDALLDIGPDWNFLISNTVNTIFYTFSVTTGNEANYSGQESFTLVQQVATYSAFNYLSDITGIKFVETSDGNAAQLHFANIDIAGNYTTGLCSWRAELDLNTYSPDAYIYLDNVEWRAQNRDLVPGGYGYETLLHELGHALGLKHPFEQDIKLPSVQDVKANTIMSYTKSSVSYSKFGAYDVAALNWLYGGDGLGGALGLNSAGGGRYITGTSSTDILTGTSGDDKFEGLGGNDRVQGGAGNDVVLFAGLRQEYTFSVGANGDLIGTHETLGTVTLSGIEQLAFSDVIVQRSALESPTPPPPTLAVSKNAAGYTSGNKPLVSGGAAPNSTVRVYSGDTLVATTIADANGLWSTTTSEFNNGLNYSVRATATDASGNVSPYSAAFSFNVDATAPPPPGSAMSLAQGGNEVTFQGNGEAGTTIQVVRITDTESIEIARTVVGSNGAWTVNGVTLPNGVYKTIAVSVDVADNSTSALNYLDFTINSALNLAGGDGADRFTPGAGNNAVDGGAGLDTVVYGAARSGFTIERGVFGVSVTDNSGALGKDNLINVERIQFGNTMVALDVDGSAGEVYRLYQAAFDRTPDAAGLAFWIKAMDTGTYSLNTIAKFFLDDKEAQAKYSQDPSDAFFVTKLYEHVLHRPAEGAGFDFWVNGLKSATRAEVLAFFSESPENQAQVIGSITNGIEYPLATA